MSPDTNLETMQWVRYAFNPKNLVFRDNFEVSRL